MGDTQVYAETGCYFNDSRKFLEKFSLDMTDSQMKEDDTQHGFTEYRRKGSYPSTTPRGLYRGGGGGCQEQN